MPEIDVTPAGAEEKPVIANLMQLYTHDFSEHWAGTARGELGDDGRFPDYPYLDGYWRDAGREPLLFRAGGHIAGFALVNTVSNSGLPVDWNMAEFFIVRKHRRGGIGTAAARAVLARRPGLWEAAVTRTNVTALRFWRHAVSSHPLACDVEEQDIEHETWNGPVIRFRIGKDTL